MFFNYTIHNVTQTPYFYKKLFSQNVDGVQNMNRRWTLHPDKSSCPVMYVENLKIFDSPLQNTINTCLFKPVPEKVPQHWL